MTGPFAIAPSSRRPWLGPPTRTRRGSLDESGRVRANRDQPSSMRVTLAALECLRQARRVMDGERDGKRRRRLGGGDELRAGASCLRCHREVQHGICHWSLGRGQREAWEWAAGEEAASEERRGSGRHGDRHGERGWEGGWRTSSDSCSGPTLPAPLHRSPREGLAPQPTGQPSPETRSQL